MLTPGQPEVITLKPAPQVLMKAFCRHCQWKTTLMHTNDVIERARVVSGAHRKASPECATEHKSKGLFITATYRDEGTKRGGRVF
jgi:hypothetical protein